MKPKMLLVLIAGLLVGADAKEDAKKEMDKLQGEWVMVSSERNGEAMPAEELKTLKRAIKGDEFTVFRDGQALVKGKFAVDPTKTPKTIDIMFSEGENKDKPLLGIYEIDGDTQKVCYGAPGNKDRPKEFSSKGDKGVTLSVWKREKK
ncbi:MAG: TIGR03067 domain-containing protein [Gemmataceae bacterium]